MAGHGAALRWKSGSPRFNPRCVKGPGQAPGFPARAQPRCFAGRGALSPLQAQAWCACSRATAHGSATCPPQQKAQPCRRPDLTRRKEQSITRRDRDRVLPHPALGPAGSMEPQGLSLLDMLSCHSRGCPVSPLHLSWAFLEPWHQDGPRVPGTLVPVPSGIVRLSLPPSISASFLTPGWHSALSPIELCCGLMLSWPCPVWATAPRKASCPRGACLPCLHHAFTLSYFGRLRLLAPCLPRDPDPCVSGTSPLLSLLLEVCDTCSFHQFSSRSLTTPRALLSQLFCNSCMQVLQPGCLKE